MRAIRLITLPALLLLATSAHSATPVLSVNWGGCPATPGTSTNRNMGVGPQETITVTVRGISGPVRGASVILRFASPGGLADAWRYDFVGCEAGRATFENASAGDVCPPLVGANPQRIAAFQYDLDTKVGRVVYLQAFDVLNPNPALTYTLGRFTFDHSAPDPCSCLETPVCIHVVSAAYLDGDSNELPFALAQEFLTWNDPSNSLSCPSSTDPFATTGNGACQPTPVKGGSWGSLKASYR